MDVRTLLVGALLYATSALAVPCANVGKLCRVDGEQSNQPLCCAGACVSHHCVEGEPGPTLPGQTTTTLPDRPIPPVQPPAPTTGAPLRFEATDVGVRFRASQDMLWNPRTGMPATQYEANIRTSTLHWVMLPEVLRLLRDSPECSVGSGLGGQVRDMTGKFFILYSLRPLRAGQPYQFAGNYLWVFPQGLMRRAANCVPFYRIPPTVFPLFARDPKPPAHQTNADTRHELDGLLDPRKKSPPLTPAQCALLHASHATHEAHALELLAHDDRQPLPADQAEARKERLAHLGAAVVATQLAFEASARTLDEQALFALIFTGAIDPQRSWADVVHFTEQTSRLHAQWMQAFHCGTGAPDLVAVWGAALGHARAHFLRAITLPGLRLREVCDAYIGDCLVSDR